ncbi:MAG: DUF6702 family protein [Bacteroidota bacterium]
MRFFRVYSFVFLFGILMPCWNVMADAKHPFHTSLTSVKYSAESKSWEISIRVFSDDFEKGIQAFSKNTDYRLEKDAGNKVMQAYLARTFNISKPGGPALTFVGHEEEADVTWIYLELPDPAPQKLAMKNGILCDLHEDQMNIVNVQLGKSKLSFLMKRGEDTGQWEISN